LIQSVSQIWAGKIWLCWLSFRLKPIYTIAPAVSKNDAWKWCQNWLKNNHLTSLIWIHDTYLGSISSTCLNADSKSAKKDWRLDCIFALLGSVRVKLHIECWQNQPLYDFSLLNEPNVSNKEMKVRLMEDFYPRAYKAIRKRFDPNFKVRLLWVLSKNTWHWFKGLYRNIAFTPVRNFIFEIIVF